MLYEVITHQGFNPPGGRAAKGREQGVGIYAQCLEHIINHGFDVFLTLRIGHQNSGQRPNLTRFAVVARCFEPSYNFV